MSGEIKVFSPAFLLTCPVEKQNWRSLCRKQLNSILFTGPPKLVVTPTKLTLLDPFHRSFTQNHGEVLHPRHYAKTRAPAISSQSQHRNGHLSVSAAPMWTDTSTRPARKMGVASLLFHRTLSPKDALQVQSYTLEKKQQPHTQLQVHSYAREHQPRQLPSKPSPAAAAAAHALGRSTSPAADCETQPENTRVLTTAALDEYQTCTLLEQRENEAKPKISKPVEPQVEVETPTVEPKCQSSSSQTQTQTTKLSKMELDVSKNNLKVRLMSLFLIPNQTVRMQDVNCVVEHTPHTVCVQKSLYVDVAIPAPPSRWQKSSRTVNPL